MRPAGEDADAGPGRQPQRGGGDGGDGLPHPGELALTFLNKVTKVTGGGLFATRCDLRVWRGGRVAAKSKSETNRCGTCRSRNPTLQAVGNRSSAQRYIGVMTCLLRKADPMRASCLLFRHRPASRLRHRPDGAGRARRDLSGAGDRAVLVAGAERARDGVHRGGDAPGAGSPSRSRARFTALPATSTRGGGSTSTSSTASAAATG